MGAVVDAFTVRTEVTVAPEVNVTAVGFRLQPRPEDGAFVDNISGPLKPFRLVRVMVEMTELPCWMVILVGFDEMEKSGVGGGALTMNCPVIALR